MCLYACFVVVLFPGLLCVCFCLYGAVVFAFFVCFVKAAELEELNRKLQKRRWCHQHKAMSSAYVIALCSCVAVMFCFGVVRLIVFLFLCCCVCRMFVVSLLRFCFLFVCVSCLCLVVVWLCVCLGVLFLLLFF